MTAADLAARIPGGAKRRGEWWDARCPARDDKRPSLSFRDEDGRVRVLCRKECPIEAIASSLGLRVADLFHDNGTEAASREDRRIVATYPYHDEGGRLLYEVVRYEPKDFRQRRPDGQGGWIWNLEGVPRVLYRLPDLIAKMRELPPGERVVYVAEGEKDADRLRSLGLPATTNPMGAGKWSKEYTAQLMRAGVEAVVILPDNDRPGETHGSSVARSCLAVGLQAKIPSLPGLPPLKDKHGEDVSDWLDQGHTTEDLLAVVKDTPTRREDWNGEAGPAPGNGRTRWAAAQSAPDFVTSTEVEPDWLEQNLLVPGSITEIFSPRGIGKTHVAHALAVKLARQGKRVLLLDRDNSRREVRRRLRGWGASEAPTLKVLTRHEVPPLTDAKAWALFPFGEYDVVILDSLDATAEGVGEKDSAKPSRAIAPILDIARQAAGPAMLVLGNTIKSAEHSRGSGVIEDRADICFEVRDATDLKPSGTKPWWLELPSAGAGAWAERAARRKRRTTYRLAFVPSKFRVGEEPDPFILEIDLSMMESWTLRHVTAEVIQAGEAARAQAEQERQARMEAAAKKLLMEINIRALTKDPMVADKESVPFLVDHGLKRAEARQIIRDREGQDWRTVIVPDRRGRPKVLLPVEPAGRGQSKASAEINTSSESPQSTRAEESLFSADRINTGRRKTSFAEPTPDAGIRTHRLFPPTVSDTPAEPLEEVDL